MRITTLTLKDFRSHVVTVLELDKYNFVRGPNGCGKSSIQLALEYLFTGRCQMTDAAGRGAEALIRAGAKGLEVSATLENGETICRRRTPRSHIVELNGKRVPVDAAQASLEKRFGSADVLSAVLNAGRFIEMSEAEQKRFLAQLVEAGKIGIPDEIGDALRALNEEPPRLMSVGDVETAHRRFYDVRSEASRTLRALGHIEKPDIPSDLPSVQDVEKKLDDLRLQKERLVHLKAEADACWQNGQGRLKQVQAELEEVSPEILSPSQEQALVQLELRRGHAEKLRQQLVDLIAEQKPVETSLATIQGLKGRCPTCGQPISEAAKAREVEALRERLAGLVGLIQGTREELKEYVDVEAATSRLEAHGKPLARRAKLVDVRSQLEDVQERAGDVESRMAILLKRINEGRRVLEKVHQLESAKERWELCVGERSALERKIGLLDRLTEFFGPSGAMMAHARSRMTSFAEDLNRHLEAFGYTCKIGLEPFEIRVISPTDNSMGLSLTYLSESEQFRFGVAFQIALAMVTGIRLVVIDGADVLDKPRRKLFTGMLLKSDLDQAIVLATSEELPPTLIPQGVKFLDLGRGVQEERGPIGDRPFTSFPGSQLLTRESNFRHSGQSFRVIEDAAVRDA